MSRQHRQVVTLLFNQWNDDPKTETELIELPYDEELKEKPKTIPPKTFLKVFEKTFNRQKS